MSIPKFVALAAALALLGLGSGAQAQSGSSRSPQPEKALTAFACASAGDLYSLLDAADRDDAAARRQLTALNCETLANRRYEVVAEKNGVVTIRLFPHDGDRAKSRLVVTLDEMVEPDLFPGSDDVPPPSS